ncbi:MAG: radical SAM family heme chaperone HemW [Treponema sp.]|nr:radical SAM family heme chaperone HemW [Treponema sp.]
MATPEFSLYLHIPFCTEKCDYCDFYSVPVNNAGRDRLLAGYTEALLWETEQRLKEMVPESTASVYVPSVYIGGGTPSLLGDTGIARLLKGIKTLIGLPEEITVEANPETADPLFLRSCAENGVTRLSLGIQSFNENLLKAAGRQGYQAGCNTELHDKAILKNLYEAKTIFGKSLSLDLMSGIPGQNEEMLLNDIEKALSCEPGHISLYALTIEEGTPLALRSKNNKACTNYSKKSLSEEQSDRLWLLGRDTLKKAGYEHYEISNFALSPAYRSIHNIRYWRMENWLGIGPAASGTIINGDGTGRRFSYSNDVEHFCSAFQSRTRPGFLTEDLDINTLLKETLLMGYRYREGPDPVLFARRFGKTIEETIPTTLLKWQKIAANESIQETIMNYLNPFLLDAFLELEKTS